MMLASRVLRGDRKRIQELLREKEKEDISLLSSRDAMLTRYEIFTPIASHNDHPLGHLKNPQDYAIHPSPTIHAVFTRLIALRDPSLATKLLKAS